MQCSHRGLKGASRERIFDVKTVVLVMLLSLLPTALAGASPLQNVSENDFRLLVNLDSPAISPDGRSVAVVATHTVWDDDRRESDLVIIDVARRRTRTIVRERKKLSAPVFSPDGTQLAFLAEAGRGDAAHGQLFVVPIDRAWRAPAHARQCGRRRVCMAP